MMLGVMRPGVTVAVQEFEREVILNREASRNCRMGRITLGIINNLRVRSGIER
jgi:hypothetical protein